MIDRWKEVKAFQGFDKRLFEFIWVALLQATGCGRHVGKRSICEAGGGAGDADPKVAMVPSVGALLRSEGGERARGVRRDQEEADLRSSITTGDAKAGQGTVFTTRECFAGPTRTQVGGYRWRLLFCSRRGCCGSDSVNAGIHFDHPLRSLMRPPLDAHSPYRGAAAQNGATSWSWPCGAALGEKGQCGPNSHG